MIDTKKAGILNRANHTGTQLIDTVEGLGEALASVRIFDSEEQGRTEVENDQYYYVASDDPNVSKTLWKRVSATESEFIADDPSAEFVDYINQSQAHAANRGQHLVSTNDTADVSPVVVYSPEINDNISNEQSPIAVGVSKRTGDLYARFPTANKRIMQNVDSRLLDSLGSLSTTDNNNRLVPMHVDKDGRVTLWADYEKESLFFLGRPVGEEKAADDKLTELIGVVAYGQSLSIGAQGQPVISTVQPYYNITFGAGPKATKEGSIGDNPGTSTTKPLVEDELSGDQGTDGNRGETMCSLMANYATQLASREGFSPEQFKVFASAAGHGAYRLDQLDQNSTWFQVWRDHIDEQKARADEMGLSYSVYGLTWIQGEGDATNTSIDDYMNGMISLRNAQISYVKRITGQSFEPKVLMYQTGSLGGFKDGHSAIAQLRLARQYPNIFRIVTPIYHIPRADNYNDYTHLSALGYAWMGAYFSRALIDECFNRKPIDYVTPGVPIIIGDSEIFIPVSSGRPLELTNTTTDKGFSVYIDSIQATISAIDLIDGGVSVTVTESLTDGTVEVRYAWDYISPDIRINYGATGDLRDVDNTIININGNECPLHNYCPAFKEIAIKTYY